MQDVHTGCLPSAGAHMFPPTLPPPAGHACLARPPSGRPPPWGIRRRGLNPPLENPHAQAASRHPGPCHEESQPVAVRTAHERQPGEHHAPGDRRLVRAGGSRCDSRLLYRARESPGRAAQRPRRAVHRGLHAIGAAGLRVEQPVSGQGHRHGARGPARPVLPRGRPTLLRLRARLHRSRCRRRHAAGLSAAPSVRAHLSAAKQPLELPTLRERWKYLNNAKTIT